MRIHQHQQQLIVHAPAKLNLFLRVLGKRPDGFHELRTLFISIGLYDTLTFALSTTDEISLTCTPGTRSLANVDLPTDSRNLVMKAALLLRQATGSNGGASIELTKRIPVEAGLGGGSSDAAATLVALNQLWNCGLTIAELHGLASRLGSDVNFFLESSLAGLGSGRGEATRPVTLPDPLVFVVIKPPTGLSTKEVFTELNAPLLEISAASQDGELPKTVAGLAALVRNDLEEPARRLNGDVDQCLAALEREDVLAAAMTGSGSACFALCRSPDQAQSLTDRMRALGLGEVFLVEAAI